jgi:hypothetical protein
MTNDIQVVANYKAGFGMELERVYLKSDKGEIDIDAEQWKEIQATLNGKRKSAHSKEMDGYTPKTAVFWN